MKLLEMALVQEIILNYCFNLLPYLNYYCIYNKKSTKIKCF